MNRMRILTTMLVGVLAVVLLSSCDASKAPATTSEVPRISVEELKERIDNGEAIVIGDVSRQNFDVSHIPGAISLYPFSISMLEAMPLDQEIVLYCT